MKNSLVAVSPLFFYIARENNSWFLRTMKTFFSDNRKYLQEQIVPDELNLGDIERLKNISSQSC